MKTKTVYQTDSDGFFLYETVAYELPLSPGTFNVPYGAVEIAPPDAPIGVVAQWANGAWALVEDNRKAVLYIASTGEVYAVGTTVDVAGISERYSGGGPIPSWLTVTQPDVVDADSSTS